MVHNRRMKWILNQKFVIVSHSIVDHATYLNIIEVRPKSYR